MELLCGRFQEYDMGENLMAADFPENRRSFFYTEGFLLPTRTGREDRRAENRICRNATDEITFKFEYDDRKCISRLVEGTVCPNGWIPLDFRSADTWTGGYYGIHGNHVCNQEG